MSDPVIIVVGNVQGEYKTENYSVMAVLKLMPKILYHDRPWKPLEVLMWQQ